jgi:hypothetical protein
MALTVLVGHDDIAKRDVVRVIARNRVGLMQTAGM